jgi:enoyl-CoA hydratase
MAQKIMSRDPIAVRYAKEAINRGLDLSLEEGLALERKLAALVVRTGTSRRG